MPSDSNSIEEIIASLKAKNADLNAKLIETQTVQDAIKAKQKTLHSTKTAQLKITIATLKASNKELKNQIPQIEAASTTELTKIKEQVDALTTSVASLKIEEKRLKQKTLKPKEDSSKQKPAELDPQIQIESLRKQKANRTAELGAKKAKLTAIQAQISQATQTREANLLQTAKKEQDKKEKAQKIRLLKKKIAELTLENIRLNTALLPKERESVEKEFRNTGLVFEKQFQKADADRRKNEAAALQRLAQMQHQFPPVHLQPAYAAPPPVIMHPSYPPPTAPCPPNPALAPYYRYSQ